MQIRYHQMFQKQKLFYLKSSYNKQLDTNLKLKLCGKHLYITTHVRYLGILIDDNITNNIVSKFLRGNSILSKLRYYVTKEKLRTIYFVIFQSYLILCHHSMTKNKYSPKAYNCHSEKSINNYELCTI